MGKSRLRIGHFFDILGVLDPFRVLGDVTEGNWINNSSNIKRDG